MGNPSTPDRAPRGADDLPSVHDTPASACPACGTPRDCAVGDTAPRPGDLSICSHCAAVNTFDPELRLRPTTESELAALSFEQRAVIARMRVELCALPSYRRPPRSG